MNLQYIFKKKNPVTYNSILPGVSLTNKTNTNLSNSCTQSVQVISLK